MSITTYKIHPFAEIFLPFSDPEFKALVEDIKVNTQREPITLYEGQVLDGVHRLKACRVLGIEPRVRNYKGTDPLGFATSENAKRRHWNESQRALVAARLLEISKNGTGGVLDSTGSDTSRANLHAPEAAEKLNVSTRSVKTARQVLKKAKKKDIEAIEKGEKTVSGVAKEIEKTTKAKEKHLDKTGYPIPEEIYVDWQAAEEFRPVLNDLQKIKLRIEKALTEGDLIFREINDGAVVDLKNAWSFLRQVLPYSVCPTCQGRTRKNCTVCKQRGFISEFAYFHWIPEETRTIREKAVASKK